MSIKIGDKVKYSVNNSSGKNGVYIEVVGIIIELPPKLGVKIISRYEKQDSRNIIIDPKTGEFGKLIERTEAKNEIEELDSGWSYAN